MICPYRKSKEERQCGNLTQTFEYFMACEESACPFYISEGKAERLNWIKGEYCVRAEKEKKK